MPLHGKPPPGGGIHIDRHIISQDYIEPPILQRVRFVHSVSSQSALQSASSIFGCKNHATTLQPCLRLYRHRQRHLYLRVFWCRMQKLKKYIIYCTHYTLFSFFSILFGHCLQNTGVCSVFSKIPSIVVISSIKSPAASKVISQNPLFTVQCLQFLLACDPPLKNRLFALLFSFQQAQDAQTMERLKYLYLSFHC